jgi:hypothetical protein
MRTAEKRLEPDWRYTKLVRTIFGVLGLIALWMVALTIGLLHVVGDIQDQRYDSIVASCRDQNTRYVKTVQKLDRLIADAPESRKARARASRAGTVALINGLAPYRTNCDDLAKERVKR